MKKYILSLIILSSILSATNTKDKNETKTEAEIIIEKIEKDPKQIKIEKKKKVSVNVNIKTLEKDIKNDIIKANNAEIEIKNIIASGYLKKERFSDISKKINIVEINDYSKKYAQKIEKIKNKKIKKVLLSELEKLKKRNKEVLKIKKGLVSKLNNKAHMEETVIEDFHIKDAIDYINDHTDYKNEYVDSGKISVFSILFLIFILSGLAFNKFINSFFVSICQFKEGEEDEEEELRNDIKILRFPIFFLFVSIGLQIGLEILNYPNTINNTLAIVFKVLNILNIAIILVRSVDLFFFIGIKKGHIKIKRLEIINLFTRIVKVLIILISVFYLLTLFGFDTNKLLASLGIGSLAIAYATKDFISRFFSGLKLIMDHSFSPGDWVKINSIEQQGVIVDIGFMNTTIRTFDNALLIVPNSIITNESYINWNRRRIGRKIGMKIGVKYDSKISDIKNAIKEIKEMLSESLLISPTNADFNKKRVSSGKLVAIGNELGLKNTLFVNLSEFGESAIIIDIYAFSKSVDWGDWRSTKEEIMFNIMEIIEKNNLEFAFPSQSIYIENGIDKED